MFLAKDCNWRRFPFVETFKLLNVNCNSLCLFRKILFTELSSKFIYERERERASPNFVTRILTKLLTPLHNGLIPL